MDATGLLIIFALWLALIWLLEPMWDDEGSKTDARAAAKIKNGAPPFARRRPLPEHRNMIDKEATQARPGGRQHIGISNGKRQRYD